ncbi:MAG: chondroitinase-B domain-containing protein [Bacteroidia bacterium]
MKQLSLFLFLLITISCSVYAHNYQVASESQMKSVIPKLLAGDEVIIKNGAYDNWVIEITSQGTAKAPIIIRAENEGSVIFSGDINQSIFKLSGNYITLSGITFKDCMIFKSVALAVLNNSQNCSIIKCTFISNTTRVQYTPLIVVSGDGKNNQVSHCHFASNIDNQDVQVKITKEASPLHTVIEHNLFENKSKVSWKNGNGGECVQVGQDPVLLGHLISKTQVRFNRFIRCNGEGEVVSNKSSENIYLKNYFENNNGELVMRGGHDCLIDGNIFKGGSGGIRINGTGHTIINNQISGVKTAIRLMYGMAKGKDEIGFYIAASGCTIKSNVIDHATIGILVGDSKDVDWTGKFDTKRYPSPVMQSIVPFHNDIKENVFTKTEKSLMIR